MSHAYSHFHAISGSPKPFEINSIFGGGRSGYSYTSGTSEQLQELIQQVNDQTSVLNELVGAVTGKSSGSALQSVLGGASFGGSALGGIASAAQSGFSWQSILKDVFPVGGLISGIAGLFSSAPTPPPLDQYAAPSSLNFDAVLNANGTLSQGSTDQYGYTRAFSAGLDLLDAAGGPYSPYQRAPNGSLVPAAGAPTSLYSGTLSLPDLVQASRPPSPANAPAQAASASGSVAPPPTAAPTQAGTVANPSDAVPTFDQQWFDDHGTQIATAVRTQLLNFHPIVDAINDL